jgi:hypothetical protein
LSPAYLPSQIWVNRSSCTIDILGDPDEGLHFTLSDPARGYTLSTELDWQNACFDASSEFLPLSDFQSRPGAGG